MDDKDICRTRYTIGIVLNVLVGGSGWLFAPSGQTLSGWFFLTLWFLTGFTADDNISRLALGAVNIISAIIFSSNFNRYMERG